MIDFYAKFKFFSLNQCCKFLRYPYFTMILNSSIFNSQSGEMAPLTTILSDPKNRPSHRFVIHNGVTDTNKHDFLLFKQYYCLSWGSITSLLRSIEKLLVDFSVPIALINGDKYDIFVLSRSLILLNKF